jgi:hypothetical protein
MITNESAKGGKVPGLSSALELGALERFPAMPRYLMEAMANHVNECPYASM